MLASLDTPEQALAVLREAHAAGGNPVHRRDIGLWAAHFGDPELAFDALRAAIDEQGGQIIYVWLPQAAAMRRLPAFKTYMHDIGMVAYWQEYGWPPLCRRSTTTTSSATSDLECPHGHREDAPMTRSGPRPHCATLGRRPPRRITRSRRSSTPRSPSR